MTSDTITHTATPAGRPDRPAPRPDSAKAEAPALTRREWRRLVLDILG